MLPFARVSIIGLGLIGSSIARAVRAQMPAWMLTALQQFEEKQSHGR